MTEQTTADAAAEAPVADAVPAADPVPVADTAPAPAEPVAEAAPAAPAPKDRRALFAALRWTAAVLVFATAGTGVAYGIARAERTDVPGLSTESDGRWTYPALAKPAVPAGAPLPRSPQNKGEIHYAPLTGLLLPAPAGASPDTGLKVDKDQLVSVDTFLEEYAPDGRAKLKEGLEYDGLRQIAARGWTMPDGTRTRVYLLRFHASGFVDAFRGCTTETQMNGAPSFEFDPLWRTTEARQPRSDGLDAGPGGTVSTSTISVLQEAAPLTGDERTRLGCVRMGDVQGVIIQSRKGEAAPVAFHQTVILQSQLLS